MPAKSKGLPVHAMRLQESFEVRELKMGTGQRQSESKTAWLRIYKADRYISIVRLL